MDQQYILMSRIGGCGKTTVARHVLHALSGLPIISLESASPDGTEIELLNRGDRDALSRLRTRLFAGGPAVIDVGVNDCDSALELMRQLDRQHALERVAVVIPVVAERKTVRGLAGLLADLGQLSVDRRIVVNRVERGGWDTVRSGDLYRAISAEAERCSVAICATPLYESSVLSSARPLSEYTSINLDDLRSSAGKLAAINDPAKRAAAEAELGELLAMRDLALDALENARAVHSEVCGG